MKSYSLGAIILGLLIVSCQGAEEQKPAAAPPVYKDGIYSATFETPDSRGWRAFLEVQVRDSQVVSANFDYVNADGALKSQDQAYAENMKKVSGVTPSDAAKALLDALVDGQKAGVAAVTGATGTSKVFNLLAAAALERAITGDASPAALPQPAE